jgi:hypothetical protein
MLCAGSVASAADTVAVPRSEFEQMKKDMAAMRQELNQLKTDRAMAPKPSADAPRGSTAEAISLLNQRVDAIANAAELSRPGETKLHLAGDASASFRVTDTGESNFDATFSPVLLWHLNKDLLFDGKVDFTLEDDHTRTDLRYAHLDWSLGDYVTLIGGKFMSPMNAFAERYEPTWINKLPNAPLAVENGILPETNVGFQLRGVMPISGPTKLNVSAYVSNPPALENHEYISEIDFENYRSYRDYKAVGGHVGIEFCPNFEIGYGVQSSRLQVKGSDVFIHGEGFGADVDYGYRSRDSIRSLQQSIDLQASFDALKGHWTLLGQYAWSDSDDYSITHIYPSFVYDPGVFEPAMNLGGGLIIPAFYIPPTIAPERRYDHPFDSHRDGGYVQLSYRGKTFANDVLNRLEFIVRGDRLDREFEVQRLTFGLDYWITESTVVKTAYELSHVDDPYGKSDYGAFTFGISTGL